MTEPSAIVTAIGEIVTGFGEVASKFASGPLGYVVGLAIVGAAVAWVGRLFGRRGRRR